MNYELITTNLSILKNRPLNIRKTYKRKRFSVSFCQTELVEVLERMTWAFSAIHFPAFPPSCVPEVSGTQAFRPIRARKATLNLLQAFGFFDIGNKFVK